MVLMNMCSPSVSTHTWVICGEPSGMSVANWQKAGSRSNFRKTGDMVCGMAPPLGVGTVTEEYRQTRCLGAPLARRVPECRQGEFRRTLLPRTRVNGPLSCARRGEALRRESSMLCLQMEPLFAPVSLWGARGPPEV